LLGRTTIVKENNSNNNKRATKYRFLSSTPDDDEWDIPSQARQQTGEEGVSKDDNNDNPSSNDEMSMKDLLSSGDGVATTRTPATSNCNNADDDDQDDKNSTSIMESLKSRLQQLKDRERTLPLVILDAMLPRQVLKIQVSNPLLIDLVKECYDRRESPYFGMLGMARLPRTGQPIHLSYGVEVEIVTKPEYVDNGNSIKLTLRGGRRFRIDPGDDNGDNDGASISSSVTTSSKGWTEAKVQFIVDDIESTDDDGDDDEYDSSSPLDNEKKKKKVPYDPSSYGRAITRAREFTSPNMAMKDAMSLIDRWIDLAKQNERQPGQIDALLVDLGPIPPPEHPSDCALWVGALINPIPAMGVALEIRPALLTSPTAEQRVEVALEGILRSIKHMDGSARLF
jgi:hypothetical protein